MKQTRTAVALTLLASLLGGPAAAWAQPDRAADRGAPSGDKPTVLAQAAEKWEQGQLTDAAPLYQKALDEGGLYPADVVIAYARIGTIAALTKNKEAALSAFRVAAVIDPSFVLPTESGPLARKLYEQARQSAAKQGGKLEVTGEAPERVDAGRSFTVTAKVAEEFAPVVEKIGIEVKDTLGKAVAYKADQPSMASVTFEVPGKYATGSSTLLVRVSALDTHGNRWATQEMRVKVREGRTQAPGPLADEPAAPGDDDSKKRDGGGFLGGPWPYVIGGAVLVLGVVGGVYFATRPSGQVSVGAPAWR